jgi:hypothetical protein
VTTTSTDATGTTTTTTSPTTLTTDSSVTIIPTDTTVESNAQNAGGSNALGGEGQSDAIEGGDAGDEWYSPLSFEQFVGICIAATLIIIVVALMVITVFHQRSKKFKLVSMKVETERDLGASGVNKTNILQFDQSKSMTGMDRLPHSIDNSVVKADSKRSKKDYDEVQQLEKSAENLFDQPIHQPY